MFKVDIDTKKLIPVDQKTLTELGLWERDDVEAMIANSFDVFCNDLGLKLLLVGKQFYVADGIQDHGDLLALDKEGSAVVFELKRKHDDNHLYQALTYAGMISEWGLTEFANELARIDGHTTEDAADKITSFLDIEDQQVNQSQRIYLFAEDFDYQTLVTAKWLREKHGIDLSCVRFDLSTTGHELFLSCSLVYPTPGLHEHAVNIRQRSATGWSDWETAITSVKNTEVAEFFRSQVAKGREADAGRARLYFRIGGKRRFNVNLKTKNAYVWQPERFNDDQAFLNQRLGPSAQVEVVNDGNSVRFYLETSEQFAAFTRAAEEEIKSDWFPRQQPKSADSPAISTGL